MNKTNWLFGVFIISGTMFLFACSSPCNCSDDSSSSSVELSGSSSSIYSSSGVELSGSSSSIYSSSGVELSSSSSSIYSSSSAIITESPDLVKKNITLSYAGDSFADIDGNVTTYNQTTVASRLDKIDLIAYCGNDRGLCENNSIYSPWEIDLFWSRFDYIGGYVFLFEIPNDQATIFKTATKFSEEVRLALNRLITIFNDSEGVEEIPIVEGKVFFVYTTGEEIRIVIIKQTGNQSVGLEIIEIPSN
jgi:hypothetical protein